MRRIAQMNENTIHVIYETESLEAIQNQFAPGLVFFDITDITPAPDEHWVKEGDNWIAPNNRCISNRTIEEDIAAGKDLLLQQLNKETKSKIAALKDSMAIPLLYNDAVALGNIQEAYAQIVADYKKKQEEILSE